jgi:ABC-type glucose/galactose transport system permease subunit
MGAEQIAVVNAVATILERMGSLPIASLVIIWFIAPWIAMLVITYIQNRRFETVVKMYEDNAGLVRAYEDCCHGYRELATFTIEKVSSVEKSIENNLYCPIVRKETRQREI